MKIEYPTRLVPLNLTPPIEDRNKGTTAPFIEPDDPLYLLDQLQKKVGTDESTVTTSIDYRISVLEQIIANLSGVILDRGVFDVDGAGIKTIPLNIVAPNDRYHPVVKLYNQDGIERVATPQIDPIAESRTINNFAVDFNDSGKAYWHIIG